MQAPATLLIKLTGNAGGDNNPLGIGVVRDALDQATEIRLVSFESTGVTAWDSRFVAFIRECAELCRKRNVVLQDDGLPEGVRLLLRLAQAVPERTAGPRWVDGSYLLFVEPRLIGNLDVVSVRVADVCREVVGTPFGPKARFLD